MEHVTDTTGTVIGRIEPVRLVESRPDATRTITDAFAAEVLSRTGERWLNPGGVRHYPTADTARAAIHTARAAQTAPALPKGLRLGANQKWALWNASINRDGLVEDKYGPALAKKDLADDDGWHYRITDLGRQVADRMFDIDGNPR